MKPPNAIQTDLKPVLFQMFFLTAKNIFYLYMSNLADYLYLSIVILFMFYIHIHSWLYAELLIISICILLYLYDPMRL